MLYLCLLHTDIYNIFICCKYWHTSCYRTIPGWIKVSSILSYISYENDWNYFLLFFLRYYSIKYISVRWVNVSTVIRSVAIRCAFSNIDYVSELQFVTLSPLFLSLLGLFIYLLHQAVLKVMSKHMAEQEYKKAQRSVRTVYFNLFLMFTFIVLPGVSVFVADMFPCRNLDPDGATGEPVYYLRYSGRILWNNCIFI